MVKVLGVGWLTGLMLSVMGVAGDSSAQPSGVTAFLRAATLRHHHTHHMTDVHYADHTTRTSLTATTLHAATPTTGPAPPKPQIPPQWATPFSFAEAGMTLGGGRFSQDAVNQRYAYTFVDDMLPGRWGNISVPKGTEQHWSFVANATASTTTVNTVCRIPSASAFADLFGCVPPDVVVQMWGVHQSDSPLMLNVSLV
jgi:hypothetical protein